MNDTRQPAADHGAEALSQALGVSFRILRYMLWIIIVLYAFSGLYEVQQHERAFVLRFGKLEDGPRRLKGPGFHITLPRPFAEVVRIPTERTETVTSDAFWSPELSETMDEEAFRLRPPDPFGYTLTGDANVLHTRWALLYKISDPETYAFGVIDADEILLNELNHAVIKTSGRMPIDKALRTDEAFRTGVEVELQRRTRDLALGVQVLRVDRVGGAAPLMVQDAFAAVVQAEQDRSQKINSARAQAQRTLNQANGDASRIQAEARAYRKALIDEVSSDADYFDKLKNQFASNPEVLYRTLLQDTLRRTLGRVDYKFIIPQDGDGNQEIRILLGREQKRPGDDS